jgi:hypothetical protein
MSHALTKQQHLEHIKRRLLMHPEGVRITELQNEIDMDWSSLWRYVVQDLKARKIERGLYTLDPSESDIHLARAVLDRAAK